MYEMRCQSKFDARYWMLGASAPGRPRGMVWGGRREEYEPAEPVFGFMYPAFSDRSGDADKIDIFHANPKQEEEGLLYKFFGR